MKQDGKERLMAGPVRFDAKVLPVAALPASDRRELADFQKRTGELQRIVLGTQRAAYELRTRLGFIKGALAAAPAASADTRELHHRMERELAEIVRKLDGDASAQSRNENDPPSIVQRMQRLVYSQWSSTSAPTGTNRAALDFVARELRDTGARLRAIIDTDLAGLEKRLDEAGAPWTPGRVPELK